MVLPVAVLKSTGSDPAPDPVVMLNGGPGGGGLEYFLGGIFGGPPAAPDHVVELLAERDVILVRPAGCGSGRAEHVLPGRVAGLYDIFGDDQDPVYEKQVLLADMILGACRTCGPPGSTWTSTTRRPSRKDLKALRAALGVQQVERLRALLRRTARPRADAGAARRAAVGGAGRARAGPTSTSGRRPSWSARAEPPSPPSPPTTGSTTSTNG